MQLNYSISNKFLFVWPVIRFIVDYSRGIFFSFSLVILLFYQHIDSLSIIIASVSFLLAGILFAHNIYLGKEINQDKLTGLGNKNSLYFYLEKEISRVDRHGGFLTLLFFDIDNFKKINDTYGHKIGDSVLIEIGKRLTDKMRNYDKLIRYGGDEFCVICPMLKNERDSDHIQTKLQFILNFRYPVKDTKILIEASVGRATYPFDTESIHGLVTIADQRMYEQKRCRKLSRAKVSAANE